MNNLKKQIKKNYLYIWIKNLVCKNFKNLSFTLFKKTMILVPNKIPI